MYYTQSSAKIFWLSFLTSLIVSALVSFSMVYFVPNILEKSKEVALEVPDVERLDIQTAQMIMDRNNLSLVIAERKSDPDIEKDRIIYQEPAPGTEIGKGGIVKVVVSDGAPVEEKILKREIIIPDVTGFELNQARVFLAEKGLKVGKVEEKLSSEPKGKVIATVPEPGKKITEDIALKLIVSSGPEEVEVPDVRKKTLYQAKNILSERGLKLGNVREITSPEYPFDIIISQDPKPGETMEKGSRVNVTINREAS
ncbi:PASTA domain-containing protein [candidate division WOR-3 bacterium]|nr:PASTA domain-containing protein [candidate division WOR-3 bacterium]